MAGAGFSHPEVIRASLLEEAASEGFPLAGTIDLDLAREAFESHVARYDRWLERGHDGAMSYLRRGRDRRADPRLVFPEAKSMLCVAQPYSAQPVGSTGPRYARYLRRADYHDDIAERLERVMARVQARLDRPLGWKICVDTSAILERSWAALAGLGWIGKNTLLIHPRHGSYLFLGEVLLSAPTGQGPNPLPSYCGSCERCLKSCPTGALPEPQRLDATRCIAYWTLEKRGELPILDDDRRKMGRWVAGCDVCQEVCPFNTKPARAAFSSEAVDGATSLSSWEGLLDETQAAYQERVRGSSLSRIKPTQFSRNLAIALANAIDEAPGPWVAELLPRIARRLTGEADPVARAEWKRCWDEASKT